MSTDRYVVMGAVLSFMLIAGALIFYNPHVGLMVIMSTMLVSYPAALRGIGPLTINNLLGTTLVAILAIQIYRTGDYWFLREPEIRMLLVVAGLLLFTYTLSIFFLPDVKRMLPKPAHARGGEGA